jgi:hypothetical protein
MPPDPIRSLSEMDVLVNSYSGAPRARLDTLRQRVVGEMIGDLEMIRSATAPNFTYVACTCPGGRRTVPAGQAMSAMFEPLCAAEDVVIWVAWDHLVADAFAVAGDGLLQVSCSAGSAPRYGIEVGDPEAWYLSATQIALFVRYSDDGLIEHEITYMDPATSETTVVAASEALRRSELRRRL